MAFGSLNPFTGIIETKFSPHARTLRTGFGRKVVDTFFVFWGDPEDFVDYTEYGLTYDSDRLKPRAGLFDYATLMIPRLIRFAYRWADDRAYLGDTYENQSRRHPAAIPVLFLTAPLAITFYVTRFIFSVAATVAALPIIGAVQLVASLASRKLKKEMGALTLCSVAEKSDAYADSRLTTLDVFLAQRKHKGNLAIVSITSDNIDKRNQTNGTELELRIQAKHGKPLTYTAKSDMDERQVNVQVQKAAVKALLRLNVGGFAEDCEKNKKLNLAQFSKRCLSLTPSK